MADNYNQYTTCTQPSGWMSLAAYLAWATAALAVVAIPIVIAAGWCSLFYLVVVAAAETVAACDWWLNVRLVCNDGDKSAVGMLVAVEPSRGKTDFFGELDTDYSINLLLYPNLPGVTQAVAEATPPYGFLMKEQPGVASNVGFFRGEFADEPNTSRRSWVLHAEFEGAGMHDFRIGALIALALAIAALIACAALPPPFGVIAGAILSLLAFLAWLIGYLVGDDDYANPSDVSGTPSELHTNDPNTNVGADLLYVSGTWVFDSFHEGWNELHPIKKCTPIGAWNGAWPADVPTIAQKLDDGFKDAHNANDDDPHSRWEVHPYIDGCGDYGSIHPVDTPAAPLH
jgi:hypothetical protein